MNIKSWIFIASIVAASSLQADTLSRETVTFSQLLEPDRAIELGEKGQQQKSKAFFRTVTGEELNAGVAFAVDGEEAVIQLSPLDNVVDGRRKAQDTVPRGMVLVHNGVELSVESDDIALYRRSQALKEAYPDLYGRAHVMQVPAHFGRGTMLLKANGNAAASDKFVLYVLDKNSDIALQLQTEQTNIQQGKPLVFDAIADASQRTAMVGARAELLSPGGQVYPLKGRTVRGRFVSTSAPDITEAGRPGELWTLRVRARIRNADDMIVERVTRVAVDLFEGTAEIATIKTGEQSLSLAMDVNAAGRYELRALIYGRDFDGVQKPAMLSFQAQWLEAGQHKVVFAIDADKLRASGLGAPFTVKSVKLLDQGRLAVLATTLGNWPLQ